MDGRSGDLVEGRQFDEQNTPDPNSVIALPTFDVVILGYRNAATILESVHSVVNQLEDGVDIVVVTSGGWSGAELVRAAHPEIAVVELAGRLMPGGARNRGVDATHGDVIGFLAADCVALPGWVRSHRESHANGFVAVSSAITFFGPPRPWTIADWLLLYRNRLPGYPSELVGPTSARRHGLSIRRAVLREVGGYDASTRIGEDTKMADHLIAAGHSIWFERSARIAHRSPRSTTDLLRDQHRRGRLTRQHLPAGSRPPSPFAFLRTWLGMCSETIAAGLRYSEIPRSLVIVSSPWIAAAAAAQLLGLRFDRDHND